jgi:hypothetical protein
MVGCPPNSVPSIRTGICALRLFSIEPSALISLLYERPVIGGTFVRLATRCPDRFGGIGEKGLLVSSLPFYYAYPSVINIWNSGLEDDYNIKLKSQ